MLVLSKLIALEREERARAFAGDVVWVGAQELVQQHHLDVQNLLQSMSQ